MMYRNCFNDCNRDGTFCRSHVLKLFTELGGDLIENLGVWWSEIPRNSIEDDEVIYGLEGVYKKLSWQEQRVYQVWAAGAIPIARKSSPLMERYIPCKKCVLFLEDFENIPAVLDEMRRIANSEDVWEEYMAWKSHPNPEVMANLSRKSADHVPCRLAEKHLEYQQKRQRNEAYFHPWNHVAIDDHAAHVAEQHRLLEPAGIPALVGVGREFFRDAHSHSVEWRVAACSPTSTVPSRCRRQLPASSSVHGIHDDIVNIVSLHSGHLLRNFFTVNFTVSYARCVHDHAPRTAPRHSCRRGSAHGKPVDLMLKLGHTAHRVCLDPPKP